MQRQSSAISVFKILETWSTLGFSINPLLSIRVVGNQLEISYIIVFINDNEIELYMCEINVELRWKEKKEE